MGIGIQICGLNGCGKSTLGRALAEKLGVHFIDNEDLFFPGANKDNPYADPRPREEVEELLADVIDEHGDFVFAAVRGDYGARNVCMYSYVIVVEVPREIRLQRVRDRSFRKFGSRMLAGGDLHTQEEAFFAMAASRQNDYVEKWLRTLNCPVIRVDGTRPIEENVDHIIGQIGM